MRAVLDLLAAAWAGLLVVLFLKPDSDGWPYDDHDLGMWPVGAHPTVRWSSHVTDVTYLPEVAYIRHRRQR